ncbi:ABC transporter permease [Streptomyces indicus]|uniref:Putative ABC transport system permease protein n=1 Tax=Streptomyces indicus TaxID=417292 RepID=A0A1G9HUA1_9ACTN|nr:ABC transporter permease [Streptomyces indicus]SDL16405.1 putative ABC transport system permease protein [Streptomyces indicus]
MNSFKRAWWRLTAHPGKTALMTGLFFVICTLVLSGFLIRSAAARAAESAKRSVGAVVTMQLDVNALIDSGGGSGDGRPRTIGEEGRLKRGLVDRICASSVVASCNYSKDGVAAPSEEFRLHVPVPAPAGQDTGGTDFFKADGILDLDEVKDFRSGDAKIVAGRGITPDSKDDALVVEERVAKDNKLKVGDRVTLNANVQHPDGRLTTKETEFTVVGVYRSGTPDPRTYVPSMMAPSNQIYVTPDGATRLDGKEVGKDGGDLAQATFTLRDPSDLDRLKKDAEAAGADLKVFPMSVNDKQFKQLVGPITKTADFATVTVWLVALAGTVILALIVASSLRERRKELGILLSLGERKPRLLGQQLVEVAACALLAIGCAAAGSQFLSQAVGDRLLAGNVSAAAAEADSRDQGPGLSNTAGGGAAADDTPEADPVDSLDVRIGPADLAKVGATGLGIAALATLVPGARVLRLNPRDILTKGD